MMTTMSIMNLLCLKLIQTIVLICLVLQANLVCSKEVVRCIQSERLALLQFKAALTDVYGNMLSSWRTADCCQWKGIGCSNNTGHVLMLDLHAEYNDDYYYYYMSGDIHKSLMELQQLKYLNLRGNDFERNDIPGFFGSLRNLRYLDLSDCNFGGQIPIPLESLSHLKYLNLGGNDFHTYIPGFFGSLRNLRYLDLSYSSFYGQIPVQFEYLSHLKYLNLSNNYLNGVIPHRLGDLSNLQFLDLSWNHLEGSIPSQLGNLSNLQYLDLLGNSLEGSIPPQLGKLTSLQELYLEGGGRYRDSALTIDNEDHNGDNVPEWFWAKLSSQECFSINISNNHLKGSIPNLQVKNHCLLLSLSSNEFEGPIPPFLIGSALIDLSQNKFSDSLPFLCANGIDAMLGTLDLSDNQLSGRIPDCWSNFMSLCCVDLSHNNFSGKIPTSMGSLVELQALILRNNSLTEKIPSSLKNCTELVMLDLRENRLEGHIPYWIGSELKELQILSLQRNQFFGILPLELCHLQSIQLFDLSLNNLSGHIPKCIQNLTSMTQKASSQGFSNHAYIFNRGVEYELNAFLTWKGVEHVFKNNELFLLKSIDLSSNHFSGEIPPEIANLIQLVSLNLSRNNFKGKIPSRIGKLTSLDFLDLSRNKLLGSIPYSLSRIDRLSVLDLSHNQLSGEIPTSTQLQSFHASSYEDNLDLCGPPLAKLCVQQKPQHEAKVKIQDEDLLLHRGFYISLTFGFIIGFWGVFGSILIKRSWRHAYFKFMNNLVDTIYVKCRWGLKG